MPKFAEARRTRPPEKEKRANNGKSRVETRREARIGEDDNLSSCKNSDATSAMVTAQLSYHRQACPRPGEYQTPPPSQRLNTMLCVYRPICYTLNATYAE